MSKVPFAIGRIFAAFLCFAAVAKHPYNFYTLTRWVVFAVCCWGLTLAQKRSVPFVALGYAAIGILFNPIFPFHFSRETWRPLDIAAGVLLLASLAFSPRRES